MDLIPAIDLVGGRVVRLRQGDYGDVTAFADDPVELADRFAAAGASWLHVVDLDAARSGQRPAAHETILRRLADRKHGRLQVGGGFRRPEQVDEALAAGVDRVLVGTLALREPEAFAGLVERHGERVCLGADARDGSVRVAGWLEDSGEPVVDVVRRFDAAGTRCFLVTAIDRDGTLAGPDLGLLEAVREATAHTLIAAGGIGTAEHVRAVARVGCDALVVGRALLGGAIALEDALAAAAV